MQYISFLGGIKSFRIHFKILTLHHRKSKIMKAQKKYKKQLLKLLKELAITEYASLETMTNLMLQKEMKENNISFKKGDTFSFEDNIFDYSDDKNIRRIAKLRKKMLKTINKLVEKNKFTDKEIEFLA